MADSVDAAASIDPLHRFETGAVRSSDADSERYDLISPVALQSLARTCAEGAAKYGDHNWLKGMPHSSFLNHALRHLRMYQQGDRTEDHLGHAMWNVMGLIHMSHTRPDLCDLPDWSGHTLHTANPWSNA